MELSRGSKGFLVVLVLVVLAVFGGLRLLRFTPTVADEGPVTVEIPQGTSAGQVADMLESEGVITSALAFRLRARFDERASRIRPGTYEFLPGSDPDEILDQLSAAPDVAPSFRVTIPEGLTVAETLERIAGAEGSPFTVEQLRAALPAVPLPEWVPTAQIPAEQPYPGLTPYEGLLFPDTYEFRLDSSAQEVLTRLVDQTRDVLAGLPPSPDLTPYQILIIGSLIEREARLADEQPVISSVIHNRLAAPMRLQVDASVLYANAAADANRVLQRDVEVQSPWNTYQVDGLPPTPIGGAGESALRAAVEPADTVYRYYVVSDPETGAHAFAETLAEHNRNVAQYRELRDGG